MIYIIFFIIGSGWGIIINDLATLDKHVHKGDEIDNTVNDLIKP